MITLKKLYSAKEAAAKLGISVKAVNYHARAGNLRFIQIGKGTKRPRRKFTAKNLASFIERQKTKAKSKASAGKKPAAKSGYWDGVFTKS